MSRRYDTEYILCIRVISVHACITKGDVTTCNFVYCFCLTAWQFDHLYNLICFPLYACVFLSSNLVSLHHSR